MSLDDKVFIKKLIPYYKDANFNDRFEHVTKELSKSRRFLVKMEINRLYNDCNRDIDLRGRVDGQCFEHKHDGRTHYLDDVALNVFDESLSDYGKYSIGVFEEVTNTKNSYREKQLQEDEMRRSVELQPVSDEKEKVLDQKTTISNNVVIPHNATEKISLTNLNVRIEERLNILTKIKIRLANGKTAHAHTTNLSVHGAKIKFINTFKIAVGDTIYLEYIDIEQSDENPVSLELAYNVLDISTNNDQTWFNLKRIHQQKDVDVVLEDFIKKNRANSTIDVEHIIEAVRSFGYQYIHLNKMVGLPIFFEKVEEQYKALFALSNLANKHLLNYWYKQNNVLKIKSLCSHQRISRLLEKGESEKPTLLFCFTHIAKGRKFFYSATEHELAETGLTDLFMQFGASKDSWKVYQLYVNNVKDYKWHTPNVLPQHLILKEKLTPEQHAHLAKLHDIEVMAYLVDISDSKNIPFYHSRDPGDKKIKSLQQFGHMDADDGGLKLIETNTTAMSDRREDRFTYQTNMTINLKRKKYPATSVDFSVHGMQINTSEDLSVKKKDILELSIPLFNRAAKQDDKATLLYEVMRISNEGKIINLKLMVTPETEHGPKTIYRIIKGNQHKLTAQISPSANFTKSLIQLYSHYVNSLVLMISKVKSHYKISHIIEPEIHNSLFDLFSTLSPIKTHCDMSALSKNNMLREIFLTQLQVLNATSPSVHKEIYIQLINEGGSGEYRTVTHAFEEFTTPKEHCEFITQASSEGQLFALRLIMSKTLPMDYKAFSREIIYAAKQASFKTRQLQAEFDGIVATAEIVDILSEVKQRFNCLSMT